MFQLWLNEPFEIIFQGLSLSCTQHEGTVRSQGIQNLSQFMRNVVIRVMLFVDIYIVQHAHSSIPTYVFSQQFFYSMAQPVLGQEITNDNPNLLDDLLDSWNSTLASACNVIKDAYTNIIVEYFQSRVEKYIIFKLQKFVPAMLKDMASKIANDYLYEILAGGNPVMLQYLLPCSIEIGNAIQEMWMELVPYMPRPCTTEEMAAKHGNFIPALHYILQQYHDEHQETPHIQELPRLISLVPLPSRNWRLIDINAETLAGLLKMPVPRIYNQRLTVFQTVFNLDKHRFFKSQQMAIRLLFTLREARKKGQSNWNWAILALMKFHHITVLVHLTLVGEMSSMLPTGVGQKSTKLPSQPISAIRSTLDMEREQPPAKGKKWRKARVNCDNNGKMTLIVFGSGMFGKKDGVPLKGHQSGVVGILCRELKKREANGEVAVVKIDEYLTSQICHACLSRTLDNMITDDGVKHHGIQVCKSRGTLWNRDTNASKNMFYIAKCIWSGHGRRAPFVRANITIANVGP
ncbi:hypothetical protein VTP01DRAFT_2308 [Rhizomucor pusillus]|uniref:uncharacterized protein n=1 Tax=Rhizomucor pusillus TaxID=4840 RepID=UPI0037445BFA